MLTYHFCPLSNPVKPINDGAKIRNLPQIEKPIILNNVYSATIRKKTRIFEESVNDCGRLR